MQDSQKAQLGWFSLFLIIFLEGFISISVEILTIRQMIPVIGNSVVVTSLIIGVFLLFLALGYYRGGYYRENYTQVLRRNFMLSAIFLGIGLSYLFIRLFFNYFIFNMTTNAMIGLIIYLFLITAPLIYFLGQTVPITTNLFKYEHHVGAISGKVLSLSTLGSFLGAILTAALLMNWFGVAWTLMINFLGLILVILSLTKFQASKLWFFIFIISLSYLVYVCNINFEKHVFVKTNDYNSYQVANPYVSADKRIGKLLVVNDSPASFVDSQLKGFEYVERIKKILFEDLKLSNKDILVVGAGGFSLSAENTYGNRFVYNDIDKDILQVVEQHYLKKVNGKFIVDDARNYLKYTDHTYDVVVVDVYHHRNAVPFHLLTEEHFKNTRRVIRDGGYAVYNIIARPTLSDPYSKRVDNTLRSVFSSCMVMPMVYNNKQQNIIYICNVGGQDQDKVVYTDDRNSSTADFYQR